MTTMATKGKGERFHAEYHPGRPAGRRWSIVETGSDRTVEQVASLELADQYIGFFEKDMAKFVEGGPWDRRDFQACDEA